TRDYNEDKSLMHVTCYCSPAVLHAAVTCYCSMSCYFLLLCAAGYCVMLLHAAVCCCVLLLQANVSPLSQE
ncbi:hypothetical protein BVRB_019400, partial [Beta vulgaris subsp. vulgaris]